MFYLPLIDDKLDTSIDEGTVRRILQWAMYLPAIGTSSVMFLEIRKMCDSQCIIEGHPNLHHVFPNWLDVNAKMPFSVTDLIYHFDNISTSIPEGQLPIFEQKWSDLIHILG